ncbi:ABC transporter substrate-binding protein [Streptomyces sp. 6N223]|uniref:ABC transporter substrate-binding protein n=1 Tax=Streptomyces sp. 6N223 TaxID=3457412 RepID=UPI003FCFC0A1
MRWTTTATGSRALAALLTAVALAVTACGHASEAEAEPETLTLWARDQQKGFINAVADAWNEDHDTQVKVAIVPTGDFVQKFGTAEATGTGPDIASIDLVFLPYFASTGVLKDITDQAAGLPYADSMSPSHRRLATYQDRTYALPFNADASVLFYNKDLFRRAGLDPDDPPSTYDEIVTAARRISELGEDVHGYVVAGQCGGCNVFEFTPHVWASGGDMLSEDGSKARFDSPEVTEALDFYRQMWTDGSMPQQSRTDNGTFQPSAFLSGKVGMIPLGAYFVQPVVDSGIDFGLAPLPGKDGGSSSFAGGDELAITEDAENPEEAWEFLRWATGREAQTIMAEKGVIPVRTDLIDEIYTPLDPRNQVLADAMERGRTPYSTVFNDLFNDDNGPWVNMINEATFGGDVAAAQETGQEEAQAIIDDAPQ